MIVIPPQDPNEKRSDLAADALGQLYEQFTHVQNLGEFHAALRNRDALYEVQHQEIGDNPQDFENLHPRDFYHQFDRRADEDDKAVVSEAPYRIRQQLRDALWAERDTAKVRALETYKKLFIDRRLAELDQDRLYYLGKIADAANDNDRERYATALIGRLKLSGDVGLLHKEDADRLIENIPSDFDIFSFNREFAADPARAQRLLLYGAYPNIRPELREELVKAANSAATLLTPQAAEPAESDVPQATDTVERGDSESNNERPQPSNEGEAPGENTAGGENADSALSGEQYAAAGSQGNKEISPSNKANLIMDKDGEDFIKFWERRGKEPASRVYYDPAPTIGYGHHILKGEKIAQPLSKADAQKLFEKDIKERVVPFLNMVRVPLSQSQVNALSDYIYHRGGGNFMTKVLPYLNAGHYDVIPGIIASDVGQRRQPGNITRHRMQANLFEAKPFKLE
jgi:GH24 family phage-related lysozyme (muramidase)